MGTLNVMLAATLAEGTTTIINAASEPEIASLAQMLTAMGATITGAGSNVLRVEGAGELRGVEHTIIPDRLEAGTFALAAAITGGDVVLENAVPEHLDALLWKIQEAGATARTTDAGLHVVAGRAVHRRQRAGAAVPGAGFRPAASAGGVPDAGGRHEHDPRARLRQSVDVHQRAAQDGRERDGHRHDGDHHGPFEAACGRGKRA